MERFSLKVWPVEVFRFGVFVNLLLLERKSGVVKISTAIEKTTKTVSTLMTVIKPMKMELMNIEIFTVPIIKP